ncbi:MAG: tRNA-dihydrouridine synthase [Phycisphaerales bacterium]
MSCETASRNATAPAPAIAPGVERLDAAAVARGYRINPRIPATVPGFDAPFFQAGLAGYSDAAMRIIARRHGCPYCVTEALLDRTLLAGGRGFAKADLGELEDNIPGGAEDRPLCGQIMGSDPDEMARAAVRMVEQGRWEGRTKGTTAKDSQPVHTDITGPEEDRSLAFASIDVNLACPVKKIKSKARGGHWLRDPEGALEILKAVREAVPREVVTTLKIRRGSDDSPEAARNFERLFEGAYELGYAWATVHGRTVEQKYVGPSRWTFLRDLVARHPDKVIFGSGDVWNVEDIFLMLGYTGVHAVSVARGCIGDPWIFRRARQMMAGETPTWPTIAEQRETLLQHFRLSAAVNGENAAGKMMRKFGIRFARHHPQGEAVRKRFIKVSTTAEWEGVLAEYYGEDAADASLNGHTAAAG